MSETLDSSAPNAEIVRMAVDIAAAYVSGNTLPSDQVPTVIRSAYTTLKETRTKPVVAPVPAVSIRRSVTPDYLVCLEEGNKLKMLKR